MSPRVLQDVMAQGDREEVGVTSWCQGRCSTAHTLLQSLPK